MKPVMDPHDGLVVVFHPAEAAAWGVTEGDRWFGARVHLSERVAPSPAWDAAFGGSPLDGPIDPRLVAAMPEDPAELRRPRPSVGLALLGLP